MPHQVRMARLPATKAILLLSHERRRLRLIILNTLHLLLLQLLALVRKHQYRIVREPCTGTLRHSLAPCTGSTSSNESKHGGGRKRALFEDEQLESSFGSVLKSLQSLVEVEKENAAVMNDIKTALLHEVEVKKKIDAQSDMLFPTLCTLPGFTDDEILKAAFIIGKDAQALGLFFRAPNDKKCAVVRNALASDKS